MSPWFFASLSLIASTAAIAPAALIPKVELVKSVTSYLGFKLKIVSPAFKFVGKIKSIYSKLKIFRAMMSFASSRKRLPVM